MRFVVIVMLMLVSSACAQSTRPATTRAATTAASRPSVTLAYRGCHEIEPRAADQHGRPFEVHGLSGVTFVSGTTFWGALDNSDKLICLDVSFGGDGSIASARVVVGMTLQDKRDFEGIAFTSPRRNSVYVSEEDTPGVHEYRLADGRQARSLATPEVFLRGRTVRNRGFEALALSPDGKTLWTANEHALRVDGTPETVAEPIGSTTRVRLVRYAVDADSGATPGAQYVYPTSGVHELMGFNSLADLIALPDGRLLALERSGGKNLAQQASIRTRVFLVELAGATDVSGPPFDAGLVDKEYTPVRKTLLFDGLVCDADGENLEGLCLGPKLGPGRWAVLGVVDDTDGPMRVSRTQVAAFELRVIDAPAGAGGVSPVRGAGD